MKIRLFHKLVGVMLAVSLVPIALLGHRLISIGQLGVKTAILELHLNMAERVAGDFRAYTDHIDAKLRFVMDAMLKLDWETKQALLASLMDTSPEFREISVLSGDGRELIKVLTPAYFAPALPPGTPKAPGPAKTPQGEVLNSYAGDPGWRSALASNKRTLRFDLVSGRPGMVFFYPFQKGLALRVSVGLDKFPAIRELRKIGRTGFPVVVDPQGRPLAYPAEVQLSELSDLKDWPIVRTALSALASGSSEYKDAGGRFQIGAYAPIADLGGAVIVKQSREEAFRYALFMQQQAVYVIFAFVLAVLVAAYLLSRQMTGPILELIGVAEKVAEGDFSQTASINTRDELKDLGETFNKMVRQLKAYSDMQVDRIIREQKNTEALMFSTEDGIVMVDGGARVQLANRKARSVMGVGQDEALEGRPLVEVISDAGVRAAVSEVLDSRRENFVREMEVSLAHSRRFFKCFSAPIVAPKPASAADGSGARLGTLVAFYDITLDKELERIKDEFLHSITHDLRNPMGAVKGFVEFLLKEIPGPINEAQRKMLTSIDRASFRLLGMINNILDIAKMEAGKMELKLAPVDVCETARRMIDLLESLGQRKKIRFVLDAPGPIVLAADALMLERMFTNLIGNAVKFAPEDGLITVSLGEDAEKLTASVGDNGDGIPLEYLDKIFEKFEQVKGQKAGGTGLGLTICKHIAAAHLGRIWVESELGKGSRFIFTIPKELVRDGNGKVAVRAVA
ncbi:MAG: ATP-binding protein [Elusimicrobiales bacterium]|jgi:signal transduction histidine kinase/HAMP domain-containing protein